MRIFAEADGVVESLEDGEGGHRAVDDGEGHGALLSHLIGGNYPPVELLFDPFGTARQLRDAAADRPTVNSSIRLDSSSFFFSPFIMSFLTLYFAVYSILVVF